nr:MAG TPA: hypothetical protein [Caudoviricetes sp.]
MILVSFVLVLTIFVLILSVVQDYFADKNMWYYLLSVATVLLLMVLAMCGVHIIFR